MTDSPDLDQITATSAGVSSAWQEQRPFWQRLEQFAENPALLTEDGQTISYAHLARLADQAGFHGGERRLVAMEIDNGVAATAAYLGALRAGHAVILYASGKPDLFASLVERYAPELVWTVAGGLSVRADRASQPLHPELAVLLSTSGSTGSAKLVRLSAGAVEANARAIDAYLGITAQDRAITTLPPSYSYGLSVLHAHLRAGASIVLTERSVTDPEFAALASRLEATSMAGVPYTYELLAASDLLDDLPRSIRTLTQAGGRLAPEMVERVRIAAEARNVRFFVMYGQTEATARMAFIPPELLARHGDCIGQPIPEGRFELVDPDSGAPAADAGELVYIGPNVMMGYAEARADLARGFDIDRLMTGDLAERAAPGIYRITGRKSRFLKLFGLRIALDEVEREAARRGWTVVATGDDSRVVLASEDGRDPAPLAGELADHFNLPPQRIVALKLDSLPRLGNGKVDYRAIVAMAPAADALAPGADPVAAYAAMLARLARKPAVADSASFQTFGGDSLNYVEASILLEEALGEVPEGWESMSLGQIKALAKDAPAPLATPGDAARSQRDTHYIHAMRSIAILLVVAAHSRQVLADLSGGLEYLSFRHVNVMFVFVAGYLFQYLLRGFNYQAYVKVKLQTVIVPYLIVSIPVICIYLLGLKDVAELNAPPWVQGKLALTAFMLLTGTHLAPLWFIPMISLVYLMAPLLRMMDQRPALYALIVPLMLLGFSIGRPEQDDNPIEALAFYLPVYLIGMAACHYRAQVLPALAKVWPVLVLLVVVPVLLPGGASAHDNLNLLAKVSLSLGVIGALSVHSRKIPAWFDKIGELSFGIYFVHGYFASGFAMAARKMHVELHGILALLAVFVVILLASIAVVLVTKAIFGRYSRQIIGA